MGTFRLLCRESDGVPFYALYPHEWSGFKHSTNVPMVMFKIDHIDPGDDGPDPEIDNADLCKDLKYHASPSYVHIDENGLTKYYLEGGVLKERDGWEEVEDA